MREIKIGKRNIKIQGSPITPYHYKQAFHQSFSGDLALISMMENDYSKLDDINLLQMVWAMEKTANKDIKDFENWLLAFEYLDISEIIIDVIEEGMNATFHEGSGEQEHEQHNGN